MEFLSSHGDARVHLEGLGNMVSSERGKPMYGSFTFRQLTDGRLLVALRTPDSGFPDDSFEGFVFRGVGNSRDGRFAIEANGRLVSLHGMGHYGTPHHELIMSCDSARVRTAEPTNTWIRPVEDITTIFESTTVKVRLVNYFGGAKKFRFRGLSVTVAPLSSEREAHDTERLYRFGGGVFETHEVTLSSRKPLNTSDGWPRVINDLCLMLSFETGLIVDYYTFRVESRDAGVEEFLEHATPSRSGRAPFELTLDASALAAAIGKLGVDETARVATRVRQLAGANDWSQDLVTRGLAAASLIDSLRGHPRFSAPDSLDHSQLQVLRGALTTKAMATLRELAGKSPALEASLRAAIGQFGRQSFQEWLADALANHRVRPEHQDVNDTASLVRRIRNSLVHRSKFVEGLTDGGEVLSAGRQLWLLIVVATALLARSIGYEEDFGDVV